MKLLYRTLCIVILSLYCCCLQAQTSIKNNIPADPSVDYTRLSNIDTLINGYVSRGWVPGVVTLIVKDGKVIQNKGYGYSNVASRKPMEPNSIFGSLRKQKRL